MNEAPIKVWRDVRLFDGEHDHPEPMAVIVRGERIETVAPMHELSPHALDEAEIIGQGGVVTPGFVDCHTHLVFGGQRADEFEKRLEGVSYQEIAAAGGGILSTVRATRRASASELFESAAARLEPMLADGVTTIEIKSGYGLTVTDELKCLRVARELGERYPVRVFTTLLGAHALPPEYAGNADGYIDLVCREMIPAAAEAGLADAVDVFCEKIAFSVAQCERVYAAAAKHGLPIKAHVEQLSNLGGAAAAARHGALSVDHIEYLDAEGIQALAYNGTTAVLLPGAFYTLRETQRPPVQALRDAGVPMAVATDGNPGTSPLFQPTLMLNQACTLFRLTPKEVLSGMTAMAAQALGRSDFGNVATGQIADLCIWNIEHPAELAYAVQPQRLRQRVLAGRVVA